MMTEPTRDDDGTLAAALDYARRGIDLPERYCEIAAKRLAQEVLPL